MTEENQFNNLEVVDSAEKKFLHDLLTEHNERLTALLRDDTDTGYATDRVLEFAQGDLAMGGEIVNRMERRLDPEFERLLTEEEEIEGYNLFKLELQKLMPAIIPPNFVAWRTSPLNPHRTTP